MLTMIYLQSFTSVIKQRQCDTLAWTTGMLANFGDCPWCICEKGGVLLPSWAPRGLHREAISDRSALQAQSCWGPVPWLCPARGLLPPSSPWLVTIIDPFVQLTTTYGGLTMRRANTSQGILLAWVPGRKPNKCEKIGFVLKGFDVKACGPQERLLLLLP